MADSLQQLVISNEEEFLNYVLDVLVYAKEEKEIVFKGWPLVDLDIKGDRYHSSLPTKLMESFVGFQQEVDKAYTSLLYNTSNRQRLTNSDKDSLELVFTIREGSTGATGGSGDWFNSLFEKLDVVFKDMSGRQKVALLAVVTLAFAGTYAGTNFMDGQTKETLEKQRTEQIEKLVDSQNRTVEAMRDIVLTTALEVVPEKGTKVVEHLDEGYKGIVKAVPDAESMTIGNTKLTNADIKRISAKPDIVKNVTEGTGSFYIESIKKSNGTMLLGVAAENEDTSFSIKVDLSFVKDSEKATIHDAFRDENPIKLTYQAKLKNGEIAEARLIRVVEDVPTIQTDIATTTSATKNTTS